MQPHATRLRNHVQPSPAVLDPDLLDDVDANPDRQDDATVFRGPEDPAEDPALRRPSPSPI